MILISECPLNFISIAIKRPLFLWTLCIYFERSFLTIIPTPAPIGLSSALSHHVLYDSMLFIHILLLFLFSFISVIPIISILCSL